MVGVRVGEGMMAYRFAGEASRLTRECSLEEIVDECCMQGGLATDTAAAAAVGYGA